MVTTGDLKVRTGAWQWKADNPAPAWVTLQSCRLHETGKVNAVRDAFGAPKLVVETVESTEDNLSSFNLKTPWGNMNVTVFDGFGEVSEGLRSLSIRCMMWHVAHPGHRPPFLFELLTNGVPLFMWGDSGKMEAVVNGIRAKMKALTVVPIQLYMKPKVTAVSQKHRFTEMDAFIVALDKNIRGQVWFPSSLTYLPAHM